MKRHFKNVCTFMVQSSLCRLRSKYHYNIFNEFKLVILIRIFPKLNTLGYQDLI